MRNGKQIQLNATTVWRKCLFVLFLAPTGELVPAKMVLQPDGEYKVEYSSRFTGKYFVSFFLRTTNVSHFWSCWNFLLSVFSWNIFSEIFKDVIVVNIVIRSTHGRDFAQRSGDHGKSIFRWDLWSEQDPYWGYEDRNRQRANGVRQYVFVILSKSYCYVYDWCSLIILYIDHYWSALFTKGRHNNKIKKNRKYIK